MKFTRILLLLALPVYFISCGTQHKLPNYLENIVDTSGKGEVKFPELLIQKNDLLSIQVYSVSTQPEKSDILYNLPTSTASSGPGTLAGGFLVDANGNIEYPRLGSFHAEGLTKQELAAQIKKKLTEPVELLKDPTVIIRFLNYKVTVIGQVGHEGIVNVPGERLTILEAVGLAGGITDYGKKDKVRIIREINGKREMGIIDLSSKDVFDSPYYNLMQNDVVYVEPTKQKARQTEQALVNQKLTIALSLITTAALLYNIFK
ncbi:MAG TPA: polysaccharide biosynthesis/export family protein [Chitinophagaceae bacterium]|nr:polysaccharide biosynthesis/export family protein [Chitinophagaceae bacterium]